MDNLKEEWKMFINMIFDPWNLLIIGAITFLLFYKGQTYSTVLPVLLVFISIASGILGARITRIWSATTEGNVITARGKSAVRNLKLLLSSIVSLDKRIDKYLANDKIKQLEVAKLILEEIKERCNLLAEESVSSIENWTDIIPEADVKTHIGIISAIKFELETTTKDLQLLKAELLQTKNKSKEELTSLNKEVMDKTREVSKLQLELLKKEADFGFGIVPGSRSFITIPGISTASSLKIIGSKGDYIFTPTIDSSVVDLDQNKESDDDNKIE